MVVGYVFLVLNESAMYTFSNEMGLDITIKAAYSICLITGCLLLSEGTLLVYHESAASWPDAHKICEESYGTLMTSHFLAFDGVRNDSGLQSSEAVWTDFYWRDTGFGNILLDTTCEDGVDLDVSRTVLGGSDTSGASHRCVSVNFTASPTLIATDCDLKLPFACQVDSVLLNSSTFSIFYFNDGYQFVSGLDLAACRSQCLGNTAMPCRSIIFNSPDCTMLPNKESLHSAAAQWNVNWKPMTKFYQRESYTDVVTTVSQGNVFTHLDPPDAIIGTTAANCEMHCAWANNRCACADFENGKCRLFTSASDCQVLSLTSTLSPDAVSVIKTSGSYTGLYINKDVHTASTSPDPPPQLMCAVPTPVISSTPHLETSTNAVSSDVTAWSVEPDTTWLTSVESTLRTSVEDVSSEIETDDFSIVPSTVPSTIDVDISVATSPVLEDSVYSTILFSSEDLRTETLPISSTSTPPNVSPLLSADPPPEPTLSISVPDLSENTYFIWQSGYPASSEFECDVISATPVAPLVTEVTTFECTFLSVHSRGLADNDTSFIEKVVEKLSIDKTETSSYKRKYASAHDSRPSARNVGIVGIVMLAVVFGGLLLLDMSTLKRDISVLMRNIRRK